MIEFKACKYLDFEDNYVGCKRQMLGGGKLFWMRDVSIDYPAMVQFCSKRGRLNNPESCLCESAAQCSDYNDFLHSVDVLDSELGM